MKPPHFPENPKNHCWAWYYRFTMLYIAIMVTLAVILIGKGIH